MAKRAKRTMSDAAESVGTGLGNFLNQVEAQVRTAKAQRDSTIKHLLAVRDRASRLLSDLGHSVSAMEVPLPRKLGRPVGTKNKPKKGIMSAEGRARIAEAQRARWAKIKAAKKPGK